jgi:hypothetical protein
VKRGEIWIVAGGRLPIEPTEGNSVRAVCRLMVDKITTVPKKKIDARRSPF